MFEFFPQGFFHLSFAQFKRNIGKVIYYKAFDKNLQCKDFQYEVGKTYTIKQGTELEMCWNGFHCCRNPLHCLQYYPLNSRFCKVHIGDHNITHPTLDKIVTSEITIVQELNSDEINQLLRRSIAEKVDKLLNSIPIKYNSDGGTWVLANAEDLVDVLLRIE